MSRDNRRLGYGSGSLRIQKPTGIVYPNANAKPPEYYGPAHVGQHFGQFTLNGITYRPEVTLRPLPQDRPLGLARKRGRRFTVVPESVQDVQNFEFLRLNRVSTPGADNPLLDERPGPAPRDLFLRNGRPDPSLDVATAQQFLRRRQPVELAAGAPNRGAVAVAREQALRQQIVPISRPAPPAQPAPPGPDIAPDFTALFGGVPAAAPIGRRGRARRGDGSVRAGPAVVRPDGAIVPYRPGAPPLLERTVRMGPGGASGDIQVAQTPAVAATGASNLPVNPAPQEIAAAQDEAVAIMVDEDLQREEGDVAPLQVFQAAQAEANAEGALREDPDTFGVHGQVQQGIVPIAGVADPAATRPEMAALMGAPIIEQFDQIGDLQQTQLGGRMHAAIEAVQARIPIPMLEEPQAFEVEAEDGAGGAQPYLVEEPDPELSLERAEVRTTTDDSTLRIEWPDRPDVSAAIVSIGTGAVVITTDVTQGQQADMLRSLQGKAAVLAAEYARGRHLTAPVKPDLALAVGQAGTRQASLNLARQRIMARRRRFGALGGNRNRIIAETLAEAEARFDSEQAGRRLIGDAGAARSADDAGFKITRRAKRRETLTAEEEQALATAEPPGVAAARTRVLGSQQRRGGKARALAVRDRATGAVLTGFDFAGAVQAMLAQEPGGAEAVMIRVDGIPVFTAARELNQANPAFDAALHLLRVATSGADAIVNMAAAAPNSLVTRPDGNPLAVIPRQDVDADAAGPAPLVPYAVEGGVDPLYSIEASLPEGLGQPNRSLENRIIQSALRSRMSVMRARTDRVQSGTRPGLLTDGTDPILDGDRALVVRPGDRQLVPTRNSGAAVQAARGRRQEARSLVQTQARTALRRVGRNRG